MARSLDWEQLPMALGDPAPAWPLAGVTPKFATWSVGGGRPVETCQRWHAGIDLTGAPDDTTILAPEDALVVGIDRGWSEGARAAFLRTRTDLFQVLGGFMAGSHKASRRSAMVHRAERAISSVDLEAISDPDP